MLLSALSKTGTEQFKPSVGKFNMPRTAPVPLPLLDVPTDTVLEDEEPGCPWSVFPVLPPPRPGRARAEHVHVKAFECRTSRTYSSPQNQAPPLKTAFTHPRNKPCCCPPRALASQSPARHGSAAPEQRGAPGGWRQKHKGLLDSQGTLRATTSGAAGGVLPHT